MSQNSLPQSENDRDVRNWMAEALDGRAPLPGKGWRHRLLDGRSVAEIMARDVKQMAEVRMAMPLATRSVLSKYVIRSGLPRIRYLSNALRTYLIEHEGMDPDDWPVE